MNQRTRPVKVKMRGNGAERERDWQGRTQAGLLEPGLSQG